MARRTRRAAAVLLAVALAVTACGNAKESASAKGKVSAPTNGGEKNRNTSRPISGVPGVTDKEISYAVVGTKTGNPLGICILDCYLDGIKAYFAFRNSEGGIYGRKLVVGAGQSTTSWARTRPSPSTSSPATGLRDLPGRRCSRRAGVTSTRPACPTYTWGINAPEAANRRHIFPSTAIRCPDCTRRDRSRTPPSRSGAKHAAALGYGDQRELQGVRASAGRVLQALRRRQRRRASPTSNDHLAYGLPNGIGPEVTAMKQAGVDFISTCIDLNGMKTLAQELKRQGMDDVTLLPPEHLRPDLHRRGRHPLRGRLRRRAVPPLRVRRRGHRARRLPHVDGRSRAASRPSWPWSAGSTPASPTRACWRPGRTSTGPRSPAATNAMTDFTAGGLLEQPSTGRRPTRPTPRPPGTRSTTRSARRW